jgi:hypothetical protein
MTPALALFLFGLLVLFSPVARMWLDGYVDVDAEGSAIDELMIRWLTTKTPGQIAVIQSCVIFGPFLMACGAVHP